MFVARDVPDGVVCCQGLAQGREGRVLCRIKGLAFEAFEFDADGVVVAVVAPAPLRSAGVPGAVCAGDKLHHFARAKDQEVRRDFQSADGLKVGVGVPVQRVGEKLLDLRAAVLAGRQADRVHDDEVDVGAGRAGAEVG